MMTRLWSLVVLMILAVAVQVALPGPAAAAATAHHDAMGEPPADPASLSGGDTGLSEDPSAGAAPIDPAVEFHAAGAAGPYLSHPPASHAWIRRMGARLLASPVLDGLLRPPTRSGRAA
jgi:hypothetical protein